MNKRGMWSESGRGAQHKSIIAVSRALGECSQTEYLPWENETWKEM